MPRCAPAPERAASIRPSSVIGNLSSHVDSFRSRPAKTYSKPGSLFYNPAVAMNILRKVFLTIEGYDLIRKEEVVLAAVSGGPDSVALLALLKEINELQ